MAEVAGPSVETVEQNAPLSDENQNEGEPPTKKAKLDDSHSKCNAKLEDRLNGILCCVVCYDLPPMAVFQVRGLKYAKYAAFVLTSVAKTLFFGEPKSPCIFIFEFSHRHISLAHNGTSIWNSTYPIVCKFWPSLHFVAVAQCTDKGYWRGLVNLASYFSYLN